MRRFIIFYHNYFFIKAVHLGSERFFMVKIKPAFALVLRFGEVKCVCLWAAAGRKEIHTHISASSLPSKLAFVLKDECKGEIEGQETRLTHPCPTRANIGFSQYKSHAARWLHSMCHQSCPKHREAAHSKHRNMKYSAWRRWHSPAQCSNTSQQKSVHVHHRLQMSWNSRAKPSGSALLRYSFHYEEPLVLSALVLLWTCFLLMLFKWPHWECCLHRNTH